MYKEPCTVSSFGNYMELQIDEERKRCKSVIANFKMIPTGSYCEEDESMKMSKILDLNC